MRRAPDRSDRDGAFDGSRLRLARDLSKQTLTKLGDHVGLSAAYISKIERGLRQPDQETVDALADALRVDPSFFARVAPPLAECSFRRRSSTSAAVQDREQARATLLSDLIDELAGEVNFPPHRVPQYSAADVERAAEQLRLDVGIGLGAPIDSMVELLEHIGVVVTRLEGTGTEIDAFSWMHTRGVVVLSADKNSATRSRFDAGHELGHLVMHGRGTAPSTVYKEREKQAESFASALLMPRQAFSREFPRSCRWDELFAMKGRWGVSVLAMVTRARNLSLIGPADYLRLVKRMSAFGWRRGEPNEPPPEEPRVLGDALALVDHGKLLHRLGWTSEVFESVTGARATPVTSREGVIDLDSVRARRLEE